MSAPEGARAPFFAALTGVFLAYAGPAVFIGLAGTFLATGAAAEITGLALVVTAAWLPPPSLALFLAGGGVVAAAGATLFKGTLGALPLLIPARPRGPGLSFPTFAVRWCRVIRQQN